jgi:hypothetical protein
MTKPIFDPADTTSRGRQVQDAVAEKLIKAAEARAKAGPTFDEKALAKSIEGLTVQVPKTVKP